MEFIEKMFPDNTKTDPGFNNNWEKHRQIEQIEEKSTIWKI